MHLFCGNVAVEYDYRNLVIAVIPVVVVVVVVAAAAAAEAVLLCCCCVVVAVVVVVVVVAAAAAAEAEAVVVLCSFALRYVVFRSFVLSLPGFCHTTNCHAPILGWSCADAASSPESITQAANEAVQNLVRAFQSVTDIHAKVSIKSTTAKFLCPN